MNSNSNNEHVNQYIDNHKELGETDWDDGSMLRNLTKAELDNLFNDEENIPEPVDRRMNNEMF